MMIWDLPLGVAALISANLSLKDYGKMTLTCKELYKKSHKEDLWQPHLAKHPLFAAHKKPKDMTTKDFLTEEIDLYAPITRGEDDFCKNPNMPYLWGLKASSATGCVLLYKEPSSRLPIIGIENVKGFYKIPIARHRLKTYSDKSQAFILKENKGIKAEEVKAYVHLKSKKSIPNPFYKHAKVNSAQVNKCCVLL